MIARISLILIVTLSLGSPLLAQQQQFGESVEVRILNVDVMVTDRNGNPIPGLTRDDFELYENGTKRDISNFFEVNELATAGAAATAPSVAIPRRHFVLFVDNTAIQPGNRGRLLPELKAFVVKAMRPGDDVAVYTWNPGVRTEVESTTERASAEKALDAIAKQVTSGSQMRTRRERIETELRDMVGDYAGSGGLGNARQDPSDPAPDPTLRDPNSQMRAASHGEKPPYDRAAAAARSYAENLMTDLRQKVEAMKSVIAALNGLEGKKFFVFVTESFSMAPAREVFEVLDSIKEDFSNGKYANPRTMAMQFNDDALFREVIAAANASGVTLYPISSAGSSSDLASIDASSARQRGVNAVVGKGSDQPLRDLADATGGVAVAGTNNFKLGFARILTDLTTFYSLGYRASSDTNAMRKIEVKVRKPGYVVRTRESFAQKTLPTEVRDAVTANALKPAEQPPESNDLQIVVTAGDPTPSGDGVTVPLEVAIPLDLLTLLPDGENVTARFTIYTSFYRNDGSITQGDRREQKVKLPVEADRPENVRLRLSVSSDAAIEAISIGVVDENSKVKGFAKIALK
ncbi:MAG TPA: VWA domain-containing protein [Thermoanaerobaculia bacterium]|nr:VWA domain-containing protein [Thermoanaerobaculia bacterium]